MHHLQVLSLSPARLECVPTGAGRDRVWCVPVWAHLRSELSEIGSPVRFGCFGRSFEELIDDERDCVLAFSSRVSRVIQRVVVDCLSAAASRCAFVFKHVSSTSLRSTLRLRALCR
eukprot:3471121-Prymnesium_polylepis.1